MCGTPSRLASAAATVVLPDPDVPTTATRFMSVGQAGPTPRGLGPARSLGWIDGVAVGRDEAGAGADTVRGDGQSQVVELRVQADDDGVRPAGGVPAVPAVGALDTAASDVLGGVAGSRHPEAGVLQLAVQTARSDGQDVANRRRVVDEVERGRPRR